MSTPPQFMVTGTGPTGTYWLGEPNERGVRSLALREHAAVFRTIADANAAIAQVHKALASVGVVFSVEAISAPDDAA
jgi:hypothetical protein